MESYLALNNPQIDVDPDINNIFIFVMSAVLIMLIIAVLYEYGPKLYSSHKTKRIKKNTADKKVWFDTENSVLYRGTRKLVVPESTIEFYVCKLIFENTSKYQDDVDILTASGGDTFKQRTVYQAVLRLNKKARSGLGIDDLFVRGKEKTALNTKFR